MHLVSMNISGMTVAWVVIGALVGVLAGATSGMLIGGKALGDYKLAAMMGGMYSTMPVLPGVILGAIVLALW
jgi:uncharacterized membrane protein